MRLLAAGEQVLDVPPKLSARTRMLATGQRRKTDATGAHSVALVATRMSGLRPVVDNEQLIVLRVLADRRRSLGEDHSRIVSQLPQQLLELPAQRIPALAQAKTRFRLLWVVIGLYLGVLALLTGQALAGQSIVRPDTAATGFAVLLAGAVLVAAGILWGASRSRAGTPS